MTSIEVPVEQQIPAPDATIAVPSYHDVIAEVKQRQQGKETSEEHSLSDAVDESSPETLPTDSLARTHEEYIVKYVLESVPSGDVILAPYTGEGIAYTLENEKPTIFFPKLSDKPLSIDALIVAMKKSADKLDGTQLIILKKSMQYMQDAIVISVQEGKKGKWEYLYNKSVELEAIAQQQINTRIPMALEKTNSLPQADVSLEQLQTQKIILPIERVYAEMVHQSIKDMPPERIQEHRKKVQDIADAMNTEVARNTESVPFPLQLVAQLIAESDVSFTTSANNEVSVTKLPSGKIAITLPEKPDGKALVQVAKEYAVVSQNPQAVERIEAFSSRLKDTALVMAQQGFSENAIVSVYEMGQGLESLLHSADDSVMQPKTGEQIQQQAKEKMFTPDEIKDISLDMLYGRGVVLEANGQVRESFYERRFPLWQADKVQKNPDADISRNAYDTELMQRLQENDRYADLVKKTVEKSILAGATGKVAIAMEQVALQYAHESITQVHLDRWIQAVQAASGGDTQAFTQSIHEALLHARMNGATTQEQELGAIVALLQSPEVIDKLTYAPSEIREALRAGGSKTGEQHLWEAGCNIKSAYAMEALTQLGYEVGVVLDGNHMYLLVAVDGKVLRVDVSIPKSLENQDGISGMTEIIDETQRQIALKAIARKDGKQIIISSLYHNAAMSNTGEDQDALLRKAVMADPTNAMAWYGLGEKDKAISLDPKIEEKWEATNGMIGQYWYKLPSDAKFNGLQGIVDELDTLSQKDPIATILIKDLEKNKKNLLDIFTKSTDSQVQTYAVKIYADVLSAYEASLSKIGVSPKDITSQFTADLKEFNFNQLPEATLETIKEAVIAMTSSKDVACRMYMHVWSAYEALLKKAGTVDDEINKKFIVDINELQNGNLEKIPKDDLKKIKDRALDMLKYSSDPQVQKDAVKMYTHVWSAYEASLKNAKVSQSDIDTEFTKDILVFASLQLPETTLENIKASVVDMASSQDVACRMYMPVWESYEAKLKNAKVSQSDIDTEFIVDLNKLQNGNLEKFPKDDIKKIKDSALVMLEPPTDPLVLDGASRIYTLAWSSYEASLKNAKVSQDDIDTEFITDLNRLTNGNLEKFSKDDITFIKDRLIRLLVSPATNDKVQKDASTKYLSVWGEYRKVREASLRKEGKASGEIKNTLDKEFMTDICRLTKDALEKISHADLKTIKVDILDMATSSDSSVQEGTVTTYAHILSAYEKVSKNFLETSLKNQNMTKDELKKKIDNAINEEFSTDIIKLSKVELKNIAEQDIAKLAERLQEGYMYNREIIRTTPSEDIRNDAIKMEEYLRPIYEKFKRQKDADFFIDILHEGVIHLTQGERIDKKYLEKIDEIRRVIAHRNPNFDDKEMSVDAVKKIQTLVKTESINLRHFPGEYLSLASKFDETREMLLNQIIFEPYKSEMAPYAIDSLDVSPRLKLLRNSMVAAHDSAKAYMSDTNLTPERVDEWKMRAERYNKKVNQYNNLETTASLFHNVNHVIVQGDVDAWGKLARQINGDQIGYMTNVYGFGEAMTLYEEEYARELSNEGKISGVGYRKIEANVRKRFVELNEDGLIQSEFASQRPSNKKMDQWEIDKSLVAGRAVLNSFLRGSFHISLGSHPEDLGSGPQGSFPSTMNPLEWGLQRWGIGLEMGGVAFIKDVIDSWGERQKQSGYLLGKNKIHSFGGLKVDNIHKSALTMVNDVLSSWRINKIAFPVIYTDINRDSTAIKRDITQMVADGSLSDQSKISDLLDTSRTLNEIELTYVKSLDSEMTIGDYLDSMLTVSDTLSLDEYLKSFDKAETIETLYKNARQKGDVGKPACEKITERCINVIDATELGLGPLLTSDLFWNSENPEAGYDGRVYLWKNVAKNNLPLMADYLTGLTFAEKDEKTCLSKIDKDGEVKKMKNPDEILSLQEILKKFSHKVDAVDATGKVIKKEIKYVDDADNFTKHWDELREKIDKERKLYELKARAKNPKSKISKEMKAGNLSVYFTNEERNIKKAITENGERLAEHLADMHLPGVLFLDVPFEDLDYSQFESNEYARKAGDTNNYAKVGEALFAIAKNPGGLLDKGTLEYLNTIKNAIEDPAGSTDAIFHVSPIALTMLRWQMVGSNTESKTRYITNQAFVHMARKAMKLPTSKSEEQVGAGGESLIGIEISERISAFQVAGIIDIDTAAWLRKKTNSWFWGILMDFIRDVGIMTPFMLAKVLNEEAGIQTLVKAA